LRRKISDPEGGRPRSAALLRGRVLLLSVLLFGAALLAAPVLSQSPGPSTPVAVPFPTNAPGQIGTTSPPQNVFYVSPTGIDCDAATPTPCPTPLVTPNLPCSAANPCETIQFALEHSHDGDAISLAGGDYSTVNPIVVSKLITIAPNGFAAGTTSTSSQATTTISFSCNGPNTPPSTTTCTAATSAAVLSGSSITVTVTAGSGTLVQVQSGVSSPSSSLGAANGCPITSGGPLPSAVGPFVSLVYTCLPGQSLPAGTGLTFTINITCAAPPCTTNLTPSMSASIAGPTASVRPIIRSCATITVNPTTGEHVCNGSGGAVFRITSIGSQALHTTLFGLTVGNAASPGAPAGIVLDNDSYTEIAKNIIGGEDLPNAIGILLRSSDHPIIHDNTIQGSTLFPYMTVLGIGPTTGGFGIVTAECLGAQNHSNGVQMINNLMTKNVNAGIWLCGDGTGGFLIEGNTVRGNGRGMVLLDAVDTFISGNTIGDNTYDGLDLIETSERNYITQNVIESQQQNLSAGILLAGNGSLFPKGNQLNQNLIRRNTVDVMVIGAQGTKFINNSITAVGNNTGVLFMLGNAIYNSGQPIDTGFLSNALQANGNCSALAGCAIRLAPGVTTPIDASGSNDFGVTDIPAIQQQIWDHGRDPALGIVYVGAGLPTPTPVPGILGFPTPTSTPTPTPSTPAPSTPSPSVTSTPSPSTTPSASATGTPMGSNQPVAYFDSSTNSYYVAMSFCISDAQGNPVLNDTTTLSFTDSNGSQLGQTSVTTDSSGCFSGNVNTTPPLTSSPTQVTLTSSSGTTIQSPVRASP
jgi:parallel beta-helix repeat protein